MCRPRNWCRRRAALSCRSVRSRCPNSKTRLARCGLPYPCWTRSHRKGRRRRLHANSCRRHTSHIERRYTCHATCTRCRAATRRKQKRCRDRAWRWLLRAQACAGRHVPMWRSRRTWGKRRWPGGRTSGYSHYLLCSSGPLPALRRGDERTIGVRADLIINKDMSRRVTAAQSCQTGVWERRTHAVTYFDMNCCESKCNTAVRGVAVFRLQWTW